MVPRICKSVSKPILIKGEWNKLSFKIFRCLGAMLQMAPHVTEDVLIRRVKTTYPALRQLTRVFLGQTCHFTIHYELLYYVSHFGLMTLSHSNKFIFIKSFELKALCTFDQAFDYYLFTCLTLVDWVGRFYYYSIIKLSHYYLIVYDQTFDEMYACKVCLVTQQFS